MKGARLTPQALFKGAQNPSNWFSSAQRQRDAAEIILKQEQANEVPYFQAYDTAAKEALAIAYAGTNTAGHANIMRDPPNYPPAQVLYAYAIENALKGLIVANDPAVVNGDKLAKILKSHDLIQLAADAGVSVHVQERPVLEALSDLSVWAGRYPVALTKEEYVGKPNPDEMLDYICRLPSQ